MSTNYKVVTKTGANNLSEPVEIMFVSGTKQGTDPLWYRLDVLERDDFEANREDPFEITTNSDLGDITDIKLKGWHVEDHWNLEWVKITRQSKSNPITTTFTIKKLLTQKEELAWTAEGADPNPIVQIEKDQVERPLTTEYKLLDNSGSSTTRTLSQTFSQKISCQVTADETRGATEEDSWFIQAGYNPPEATGGGTISAGYAGRVTRSVEKKTGQASGQEIEFSETHSFEVPPRTLMLIKAVYVEVVKKGNVSYFDKKLPFVQVSKILLKEYTTTEYKNRADIPGEFLAQLRAA